MRALIQRVSGASVTVEGQTVGRIGDGLVVLLGVGERTGRSEAVRLADKSRSCGSSTTTTGGWTGRCSTWARRPARSA